MTYEEIQAIALSKLPPELRDNSSVCEAELAKAQVKSDNNRIGKLNEIDGIDCPICKNKGYTVIVGENNLPVYRDCECMKSRLKARQINDSGLGKRMSEFVFDKFKINSDWQKFMLDKAKKFCYTGIKRYKWIYYCGESGSGKSSICSAICNDLLNQGYDVKYYDWRTVIGNLKDMSRDSERLEERKRLIKSLQRCEVLFLDDLFKTLVINDTKLPLTPADVNITRDILNYRYNEFKTTILTGEYSPSEIIKVDEALGGRIVEMTEPDYLIVLLGKDKNQRLNGGKIL